LFELAKEANKLETIHENIMYAWEVAKVPDFKDFLKSPIISTEKKEKVFKAVFEDKVEKVVLRTFYVMTEHQREAYLTDFCRTFHLMYNREKHISSARLISAVQLSDETVNDLLKAFKDKGLLESEVELVKEIDADIIGGFVLEFNNQVYDASVQYKLEQLRKKFSENLYIKNI